MSAPEAAPDSSTPDTERSILAVLRGNPSDPEIAAIVIAVHAAASAESAPADRRPPELWGSPTALHRGPDPFAPHAYSASTPLIGVGGE